MRREEEFFCNSHKKLGQGHIGKLSPKSMDEKLIIKTTVDASLALPFSEFLIRNTFGTRIREFASVTALSVFLQAGLTERGVFSAEYQLMSETGSSSEIIHTNMIHYNPI